MYRLIIPVLAAATLAGPALAGPHGWAGHAHERHEGRGEWHGGGWHADRHDWREDRREWHRDRNEDRRDWREDRHEDHWRDIRWDDRAGRYYDAHWRGPAYYHPPRYAYSAWAPGFVLPSAYWGARYWIVQPAYYRLPPPRYGTRWVRVGPDALLIRIGDGFILQVVRGLVW